MFNEEARRKEQGVAAESEALVSEYSGRSSNRKLYRREKSKIRSKDDSREMRLNMISIGLLDDEGYINVFAEGKWKLSKNSFVLARGKKENTLYMTHAKVSNGYVNVLTEDSIELWRKRLGHMSEKWL
ncbi:unnamed protein product [Prunus brigantina]